MCLEEFGTTDAAGGRTKVSPFQCNDGTTVRIRHAICRACDNALVRRGSNCCPICRAPRIGTTRLLRSSGTERRDTLRFPVEQVRAVFITGSRVRAHANDARFDEQIQTALNALLDVPAHPIARWVIVGNEGLELAHRDAR